MSIIKKKLSLNINIDLPLLTIADPQIENALIADIEKILADYKKSGQLLNSAIRKKTTTTSLKKPPKSEINEK